MFSFLIMNLEYSKYAYSETHKLSKDDKTLQSASDMQLNYFISTHSFPHDLSINFKCTLPVNFLSYTGERSLSCYHIWRDKIHEAISWPDKSYSIQASFILLTQLLHTSDAAISHYQTVVSYSLVGISYSNTNLKGWLANFQWKSELLTWPAQWDFKIHRRYF